MLAQNISLVRLYSVIRPAVLSLLFAGGLLLLARWIFHDGRRAALVTSVFLILFFSYGHVRAWLGQFHLFGSPVAAANSNLMAIPWAALLVLAAWWVGRKVSDPGGLNLGLNLTGAVLVVFSLVQIGGFELKYNQAASPQARAEMQRLGITTVTSQLRPPPAALLPDVYYIILDGYARQDVLRDQWKLDNSAFLQGLEQRGFYVADCARSNYPITVFSLGSSLNMQLIGPFAKDFFTRAQSWENFGDYMRRSAVRYTFEELGYRTVAFDTSYLFANFNDADVFFSLQKPVTLEDLSQGGANGFEQMLLRTTPVGSLGPSLVSAVSGRSVASPLNGEKTWTSNDERLYDEFSYALDSLESTPNLPGRKFVFAHMVTTHKPFVFAPDGSFRAGDNSDAGYVDSVTYTNGRILKIVDTILAKSRIPPIIVIQGDHARPESDNKNAILNAYYLPRGGNALLYPTISPVNTFRLIFNHYFGGSLPLLPDTAYRATPVDGIYHFDAIPEANGKCIEIRNP